MKKPLHEMVLRTRRRDTYYVVEAVNDAVFEVERVG